MSAFSHLPYRPCVGIMLLNKDNQVFVGSRIDKTSDAWQMPQGGVDEGENIEAAARRELREETSVSDVEILAESNEWLNYDLPDDLIPKLWGGKFRGQAQKWFAMRLEADDSHVNIETSEPEFHDWKWVSMEQLPQLIVPFKRKLYEQIVAEFRHLID